MIYCSDITQIVKEVYGSTIIPEIDIADIKQLVNEYSYDKCKISCLSNLMATNQDFVQADSLSPMIKEYHFGTKYRRFLKPPLQSLKSQFASNEWQKAIEMLQKP